MIGTFLNLKTLLFWSNRSYVQRSFLKALVSYKQHCKAEHHAYDCTPYTDFGAILKDYPQSHRLVGA